MEKTVSLCHPLPASLLFLLENYFPFKSYVNLEIQAVDCFLFLNFNTRKQSILYS